MKRFLMILATAGCGEELVAPANSGDADDRRGIVCDPQMGTFPVDAPHNIGYDQASCGTGTCEISCPDQNANSDWGGDHHGIDVFAFQRAPLVAVADAEVVAVGTPSATSGLRVRIRDACGWEYYYGHMDEAVVSVGQWVSAATSSGTWAGPGPRRPTSTSTSPTAATRTTSIRFDYLAWTSGTACDGGGSEPPPPAGGVAIPTHPGGCGLVPENFGLPFNAGIASCDGRFVLTMQGDGNLVLTQIGRGVLWHTGTHGHPGAVLWQQGDGNLVIYDASGRALWSSGTQGHPGRGPRGPGRREHRDLRRRPRALGYRDLLPLTFQSASAGSTGGPGYERTVHPPCERCGHRPGRADTLRVDPDGWWFVPPGGVPVECRRWDAPRRVLGRLARECRSRPGIPVPWRELFAAGWPGQNILESAAKHRLKVAVSTLRRLGVGEAVRHQGDGYLLEAKVAGDVLQPDTVILASCEALLEAPEPPAGSPPAVPRTVPRSRRRPAVGSGDGVGFPPGSARDHLDPTGQHDPIDRRLSGANAELVVTVTVQIAASHAGPHDGERDVVRVDDGRVDRGIEGSGRQWAREHVDEPGPLRSEVVVGRRGDREVGEAVAVVIEGRETDREPRKGRLPLHGQVGVRNAPNAGRERPEEHVDLPGSCARAPVQRGGAHDEIDVSVGVQVGSRQSVARTGRIATIRLPFQNDRGLCEGALGALQQRTRQHHHSTGRKWASEIVLPGDQVRDAVAVYVGDHHAQSGSLRRIGRVDPGRRGGGGISPVRSPPRWRATNPGISGSPW